MVNNQKINVSVVFALPDEQEIVSLTIPADSTVKHAIEVSGLLQKYKQIDLSKNTVGIYGKIVKLEQLLNEQDRIEIYRSLITEPMQARRKRAGVQN